MTKHECPRCGKLVAEHNRSRGCLCRHKCPHGVACTLDMFAAASPVKCAKCRVEHPMPGQQP